MDIDGLVGRRVSLRQRVGERDGRAVFSDAVGELAREADELVVRTRRGPVPVRRAAVVAVRAVPPAPPRRASWAAVARLEGLCADAWPAMADEPLGAWRLRAAGGYTGRANSALAIGDAGVPIATALDVVGEFAARHGIGPRVQVPVGSPWDRAVAGQGWVLDVGHAAGAEVSVLVAELDSLAEAEPPRGVELPERPDEDWWALAAGGEAGQAMRHVLGSAPHTTFVLVRGPDGAATGQLRATMVEDHLHLSVLNVVPAARRTGLATGLLSAAARWGRERGARWAVLQAALQNEGAHSLYERTGFTEHHKYRYLVPPPPPPGSGKPHSRPQTP
jgi:N-acetylglutamate synthase